VIREEFGGGDVARMVKRFKALSRTWQVETCYEAGPSGYGLARALSKAGIQCRVVAPTLIPRRPGNRVKTDARDAKELALALRAGTLEFVRIPTMEEEEVRALVRCREDIARQVRVFKMTISHWLLSREHRSAARDEAMVADILEVGQSPSSFSDGSTNAGSLPGRPVPAGGSSPAGGGTDL
jgi:transposase